MAAKQIKYKRMEGRVAILLWIYRLTLVCGIAQALIFLFSWLLSAAMPDVAIRSLLSAAGIRWFIGSFGKHMSDPLLVYLVVIAIAFGGSYGSGLLSCVKNFWSSGSQMLTSQQRFALRTSAFLVLIELVIVACLTLWPHAVLLSVTGELFPSSFSVSIVPILCFIVTSASVLYGLLSGNTRGLFEVGQSLTCAGKWLMPLLLLYVFAMELAHSCLFVMGC